MEKQPHECSKCVYTYLERCPCANHLHNAACLTMFKDISKWGQIFCRTETQLGIYESSRPKMDELLFVQRICDENEISRKDALWVIRELRRKHRRDRKMKD